MEGAEGGGLKCCKGIKGQGEDENNCRRREGVVALMTGGSVLDLYSECFGLSR